MGLWSVLVIAAVAAMLGTRAFGAGGAAIYVSPGGNDDLSGTKADPAVEDGPVKTLQKAIDLSRKHSGERTIYLRGGTYRIDSPVVLNRADQGLTICAQRGEKPVIDGSEILTGWRPGEFPLEVKRATDKRLAVWAAPYDGPAIRSLFVNGRSCPRPRWPKITPDGGFLRIESVPGLKANGELNQPADKFILKEGDFIAKHNLADVEIVAMQLWIAARFPCLSYEPATRLFTSTHRTPFKLEEGWGDGAKPARYYIDNVYEALSEPGEWYHDRERKLVYYIPRGNETLQNTRLSIGRSTQMLRIEGTPDAPVSGLHIRDLTFACGGWYQPSVTGEKEEKRTGVRQATAPQAETHVPGLIQMRYARDVSIENCELRDCGFTAIRIEDGCSDVRIERNHLHDLGGGGIHINGADANGPAAGRTSRISVRANHIHDCGRIFHAAIGILSRHADHLTIAGNHIHDLYYSGISCGWVWGYAASVSRDNLIEGNYIHDLGHQWLSDMGGIYTLGIQPGTVLRNNVIHGIHAAQYGGWAYYFDEGSSDMLMENNIGFDTTQQALHLHYGKEIRVRNNILACGGESVVMTSRKEPHTGLILERNILLTRGKPVFSGQLVNDNNDTPARLPSDRNIIWDIDGKPLTVKFVNESKQWDFWTGSGHDKDSLLADPGLPDQARLFSPSPIDARNLNLTPAATPARQIGFTPIEPPVRR